MIERLFWTTWWPGLLLWVVLYISDYVSTIVSLRSYRARASEHLVFEGSFELNPIFQADVDALRWISPRFVGVLIGSCLLLLLMWWMTHQQPALPAAYEFLLGAFVLVELAVHMRHLRNLYLFKTAFGPGGLQGRIEYPRALMLRLSAFEFLEFSGLYLVLFGVTGSWFFLGGVVSCMAVVRQHGSLARKARRATAG